MEKLSNLISSLIAILICAVSYSQCPDSLTMGNSNSDCNGNSGCEQVIAIDGNGDTTIIECNSPGNSDINCDDYIDSNLYDNFIYNNCLYDSSGVLITAGLPIELTSFDGHSEGRNNVLNWTTASEINNDYFQLEKSIDGFNFKVIAKVEGSGNTNTTMSYKHIDKKVNSSISYYKLKQVDYDGEYEYFDIISVKNDNIKIDIIIKNNFIHLSGLYNYSLYDHMGKLVIDGQGDNLDISKLPKGIYILKAGSFTKKIYIN